MCMCADECVLLLCVYVCMYVCVYVCVCVRALLRACFARLCVICCYQLVFSCNCKLFKHFFLCTCLTSNYHMFNFNELIYFRCYVAGMFQANFCYRVRCYLNTNDRCPSSVQGQTKTKYIAGMPLLQDRTVTLTWRSKQPLVCKWTWRKTTDLQHNTSTISKWFLFVWRGTLKAAHSSGLRLATCLSAPFSFSWPSNTRQTVKAVKYANALNFDIGCHCQNSKHLHTLTAFTVLRKTKMKRLLVRRTSDKERGKGTDQRRQVTETRKTTTHTPMF